MKKPLTPSNKVYEVTDKFPQMEQFGLSAQFKRAAVSIALNIAEGAGRYGFKEKKQYYRMARASINECVAIMQISKTRGYIEIIVYEELYNNCLQLAKMLSGLINAI